MRPDAGLVACLVMGGCAGVPVLTTAPAQLDGYLGVRAVQAVAADVTPTPVDPPAELMLFHSVGPGTDRWWLAIAQAELRPPEAAQHFDCVLGTRMADKPRPALTRLMSRLLIDSVHVTNDLAAREPRLRPIAERPELKPCVRIDEASRNGPSWPAVGAVVGAAYGEMFAALAPDQADAARGRGSDIGYSRALCRVNWHADVTDGLQIGRAVYEHAAATPEFADDLEAARAEVVTARTEGLSNPSCAAESRALRQTAIRPGEN